MAGLRGGVLLEETGEGGELELQGERFEGGGGEGVGRGERGEFGVEEEGEVGMGEAGGEGELGGELFEFEGELSWERGTLLVREGRKEGSL